MPPAAPFRLIYCKENEPPRYLLLSPGEICIGRSSECELMLDEAEISRRHARLRIQQDGQITLTDQGSANGTQLEGKPLPPRQEVTITAGQYFQIGPYRMALLQNAEPIREVQQVGEKELAAQVAVQPQAP
ncbi:MAG: FHA domain-containing protein, partial [Anaerolineaceae bacterium]